MELNENSLNLRVSTASLPRYALLTIFSSIFMNIYSIVDQLFVSNLLGTDAMSAVSITVMSVFTFAIAFPLARPIARLFADGSESVISMAVRGMFIFAAAFLLMGFNLFASGFFTALNDGKTSALLSLFRTLIFLIIPLLTLPNLLGVDGVWISMPAAEVLSILLSIFYFQRMKNRYHYA